VLFVRGSVEIADDSKSLASVLADVQQLNALAAASGRRFEVDIVGHTDAEGADDANVPLSLARAQIVADAVRAESVPALTLSVRGVGSAEPADAGRSETSNQLNRRVDLRVRMDR
jgi:outer membrane protein OmpA-like peptidoglycan-associated protein